MFRPLKQYTRIICVVIVSIYNVALAEQDLLQLGLNAYHSKDYQTAWSTLYPLAQDGQREAQRMIGVMFCHGLGVKQNDHIAVEWYQKAGVDYH